ncbi:MAG: HAMP domain-containing histidine kinase [Gloeomargaritaceae cyanobacterium C42_A2020_066]|nr:HAMP domain-containing histidine kinase [Gloeomargaritaceae cyanobacterium C42_A2020_066]
MPVFVATRRRLALWYASVTALLLLAFALGFYTYVRATLIERIDDTLDHVAEVIQRATAGREGLLWPCSEALDCGWESLTATVDLGAEEDRIELEWFGVDGQPQWSTLAHGSSPPLHPQSREETVYISGGYGLRQLTQPFYRDGQLLGYLRVSHPWFEVTRPSRQLFRDLAAGLLGMVSLVGAAAWFLSGLAIRPVQAAFDRLEQFTADASHELRTPLTSLQVTLEAARAVPNLSPAVADHLAVLARVSRRLSRLVDDLLFLARRDSGLDAGPWEDCPLDALLMEVVEEQQPLAAQRQIALSLALPPDDSPALTVPGDYGQLVRLFTNLLANALQYTPAQGQVMVSLMPQAAGLEVQVRDTGIGIPEVEQAHIFQRFYRADPVRSPSPHQGSGLGLAIVQAIADRHQGRLELQSRPHQGTTVRVWLPGRPPRGGPLAGDKWREYPLATGSASPDSPAPKAE